MTDFYQTWRAGKVVRMHTMPQLHRENVAEHTWGILLAVMRFWPDAPAHFLKAVILHDAGEISTGDIPAHVKWASRELEGICAEKEAAWLDNAGLRFPELSNDEHELLTVFDKLDFCVSCIHEMRLGNLNAARYFRRSWQKAADVASEIDDEGLQRIANEYIKEVYSLKIVYCSHIREEEYDLSR